MKKKYFIIGSVVIAIIILLGCCFSYKKISVLKINPFSFLDEKSMCSTDSLINEYFSGFNKEYSEIKDLNLTLDNINPTSMTNEDKALIEEVKSNLTKVSSFLNRYSKERVLEFVTSYSVKEYNDYFNSSSISNILKSLKTTYDKNEEHVNALFDFVGYLTANQDKYRYFKKTLYYEDEEFKKNIDIYTKRLKINIPIKKGQVTKKERSVPVLMYHAISDKTWGLTSLFVGPKKFEEHLKYLKDKGYTTYFLDEIEYIADDVLKPIVLTFDDGYVNLYTEAYDLLKKYEMKATIYAISGWADGEYYLTHDQLIEMDNSPYIDIQSHTVNHIALAHYKDSRIEQELKDSKATLEKVLNKQITSIAYPVGSYDERVIKLAKKYYEYGLLAGGGKALISKKMNDYKIERIGIYHDITLSDFISKVS
ncbi:MAG: polysaccharide deacetylase family protein [Bacilli bacterium]